MRKPYFNKAKKSEAKVDKSFKKEAKKEAVKAKIKVEEVEEQCGLKYLGAGPLSGEYRFEGVRGSIAASSVEDAKEKARELLIKHPSLLKM